MLHGEVDVDNADVLAAVLGAALDTALSCGRAELRLDLAALGFLDVTACRAIADTSRVFRAGRSAAAARRPTPARGPADRAGRAPRRAGRGADRQRAMTARAGGGGGYLHHALFYDSPQALVAAAGPFLRAGLAAGDLPVLVCGERNNALLAEALGGEAEVVVLEPASIYTRVLDAVDRYQRLALALQRRGAHRVRLVGEVDFGPPPDVGRMDPVRGDREPRARALSTVQRLRLRHPHAAHTRS